MEINIMSYQTAHLNLSFQLVWNLSSILWINGIRWFVLQKDSEQIPDRAGTRVGMTEKRRGITI
jgi:hypothetical protein